MTTRLTRAWPARSTTPKAPTTQDVESSQPALSANSRPPLTVAERKLMMSEFDSSMQSLQAAARARDVFRYIGAMIAKGPVCETHANIFMRALRRTTHFGALDESLRANQIGKSLLTRAKEQTNEVIDLSLNQDWVSFANKKEVSNFEERLTALHRGARERIRPSNDPSDEDLIGFLVLHVALEAHHRSKAREKRAEEGREPVVDVRSDRPGIAAAEFVTELSRSREASRIRKMFKRPTWVQHRARLNAFRQSTTLLATLYDKTELAREDLSRELSNAPEIALANSTQPQKARLALVQDPPARLKGGPSIGDNVACL